MKKKKKFSLCSMKFYRVDQPEDYGITAFQSEDTKENYPTRVGSNDLLLFISRRNFNDELVFLNMSTLKMLWFCDYNEKYFKNVI